MSLQLVIGHAAWMRGKKNQVQHRDLRAWCLLLVTAGDGSYRDAQGVVPVRCGDVLTLVPGRRHGYGPSPGTAWDEVFCVCSGPGARALDADGLFGPPGVRHAGLGPALVEHFDRVVRHATAVDADAAVGAALVHLLAAEVAAAVRRAAAHPDVDLVRHAAGALAAAPELGFAHAAHRVGADPERLRRSFAHTLGAPPDRWRRQLLAERAKYLLAAGATLDAAAAQLGLCDGSHLARIFRAAHGLSPGAWRRQHLGRVRGIS